MRAVTDLWRARPALTIALAIGLLAALRIAVVVATPLELGPDEAQYWRWSRSLDWGYYSKPPLIAWIIAAATSVFGEAEWAVRMSAPVLHGLSGFLLFLLGRDMFSARIGAWAAAIYLLMPGVWLSSAIMSTDAVLLPMWSAALYGLWRLRDRPGLLNGALAGAAIGLAMLAKYAALYLFVGAGLAALVDRDMRRALLSLNGLVAVAAALAVLAPNLLWNAANDFATVSHTTDNANLGAAGFNPLHVFSFIADQMAVFGPISVVMLGVGFAFVVAREGKWSATRELWLLCFIAPALLVILGQEILSRAHANWAASAYPAASVLVACWIDRAIGRPSSRLKAGPVIKSSVALNAFVGVVFVVLWIAPSLGDAVGGGNAYKRVRGWEQTSAELGAVAAEHGATSLMFDEREVWHGVDYYGRDMDLPPLRAWRRLDSPRSHAEEAGVLLPGDDRLVLVASAREDFRPRIRADFASIEAIGTLEVPLGPSRTRRLKLYLASGYQPLPRTPEYEATYASLRED